MSVRRARSVPARRLLALVAVTAVIAVACTSTTSSSSTQASPSGTTSASVSNTGCDLPIPGGPQPWPYNDRRPDPSVVPQGGKTKTLENPPKPQKPANDCAPIDPKKGIDNINHLVFIVMENRSFDHYFGTFPGADGYTMKNGKPTNYQVMANGKRAYVYHDTNFIDQGGPHGHRQSLRRPCRVRRAGRTAEWPAFSVRIAWCVHRAGRSWTARRASSGVCRRARLCLCVGGHHL